MATVIGTLAALIGVTAFLPQVGRIIKTRETKDLSAPMWILQVCGFALWVAYGIALGAWPIIVPNIICGLLAAFILTMKLLSQENTEKVAAKLDPTR